MPAEKSWWSRAWLWLLAVGVGIGATLVLMGARKRKDPGAKIVARNRKKVKVHIAEIERIERSVARAEVSAGMAGARTKQLRSELIEKKRELAAESKAGSDLTISETLRIFENHKF